MGLFTNFLRLYTLLAWHSIAGHWGGGGGGGEGGVRGCAARQGVPPARVYILRTCVLSGMLFNLIESYVFPFWVYNLTLFGRILGSRRAR